VSTLYWQSEDYIARLRPFFPKGHGRPRVDDPLPSHSLPANRERAGSGHLSFRNTRFATVILAQ
jgi:hypothetical protein